MTDGNGRQPKVVSEVWKWIAISAVSILIGLSPDYFTKRLTLIDVDKEISAQTGVFGQKLDDLKETVNELKGEIKELKDQNANH